MTGAIIRGLLLAATYGIGEILLHERPDWFFDIDQDTPPRFSIPSRAGSINNGKITIHFKNGRFVVLWFGEETASRQARLGADAMISIRGGASRYSVYGTEYRFNFNGRAASQEVGQ
jgi:hypothetical protein